MTDFIVDLQPIERGGLRGIAPEFFDFIAEELALFRVIVETACLYLFGPPSYFRWRFFLAALIEPLDHLLVACALLDLRFEIVALQYEKGAASLTDYLDALRSYIAIQTEYFGDLASYWTAIYQLEAAIAKDLRS